MQVSPATTWKATTARNTGEVDGIGMPAMTVAVSVMGLF
jgi:hypothetical protein